MTSASFTVACRSRAVPVRVWSPTEPGDRRPLVLLGHGGGGNKDEMASLGERLVHERRWVAAAIDGPVHGERRDDDADRATVLADFRALWREGTPRIDEMVADWRAVLDVLVQRPDVDAARVAWRGVSMGTAYGLPFVAADRRIVVAAFGMWGLSYPSSERLAADAPGVRCPVLFQRKTDDAVFTAEGQAALFGLIGSEHKRLEVHPGGHRDDPPMADAAIDFLADHLGR